MPLTEPNTVAHAAPANRMAATDKIQPRRNINSPSWSCGKGPQRVPGARMELHWPGLLANQEGSKEFRGGGEGGSNDGTNSMAAKFCTPAVSSAGMEMAAGLGSMNIIADVNAGAVSWQQDIEQLVRPVVLGCSQGR